MEFDLALCFILIRIILPLVLGTAVIFRQNLFSCIYLILLLIGPILPKPSAKTVLSGSVGVYIKLVILISLSVNVAHVVFQIVLFSAFNNYDQSIDYCDFIGRIYNLIGLHRYNGISVWNVLRLCGLDFLVLISCGSLHILTKKAYQRQKELERAREELAKEQETKRLERMERRERRMTEAGLSTVSVIANNKAIQEKLKKKIKKQKANEWAYFITEAIFLILLCSAAILNPSVTSSLYFISFLCIATWLSCNRSLGIQYHYFRIFIAIYVALHYILLFIYQMEFVRPYLPPQDIKARVFGFVDYVNINCTSIRELDYQSFHWAKYVHPFILLILYFISATLIRTILFGKKSSVIESSKRVDISGSPMMTTSHRPSDVRSDNLPALTPNTCSSVWMRTCSVNKPDGKQNLLSDDRTGKFYNTSDRTKLSGNSKGGLEMDANGSITWKPENEISNYSSISGAIGQSASRPESPVTPGDHLAADNSSRLVSPLVQFIKLIKRGSYVGTLIVMMTWSITYHSWLSFILLLWSCIIWMMPNSRQACLKSSPALVFFALFLLVGQYVYSLDLTEQELPEQAGTVSMSEIGFRKYFDLSYQPLFIKILYTIMFWLTLRQFLEDRERDSRKQFAQGVMVQPFNIGYGTGQAGLPRHDLRRQMSLATTTGTHQSPVVQWISDILKELLIKYWIWVVATMLMVMSLSGDRVVLYRVVYMFLFLTFVLLFQLSFALWRRFMYTFWLIVIVYSMIILTAIYTYQFNQFPQYWNQYLKINKELQDDLGLVVYDHDAWILFKELFTPTFFLIITIIQVHFLHKDFLEFSNFEKNSSTTSPTSTTARSLPVEATTDANDVKLEIEIQSESSNDTSTPNTIKSVNKTSSPNTIRSNPNNADSITPFATPTQGSPVKHDKSLIIAKEQHSRTDSKNDEKVEYKSSIDEIKEIFKDLWHNLEPIIDSLLEVVWRLLEIHLIKVVLFCSVLIAIADISAMNTIFVILVVVVMTFTQFEGIISHLLGLWAGILILLKMLFQLHVAQDIGWHTNCTDISINNSSAIFPFNTTIDNREYIGFKKTSNIFGYITEYIILILVLVFRTVVIIHQNVGRLKRNERPPSPGVVFPRVGRKDADRDLKGLTMFLINYCFYKFGVEICFILLTISIGSRHDVFSVFYSIWLLVLVLMNRQTIEKVWPYFVGFLSLVLPLQYLLCLGIPPGLCFDYPWSSDFMNEQLRDWLFLPDFRDPLEVGKLYLDFLILLFSCRQLICFRLEKTQSYLGGSNIEAHLEPTLTHTNNVPDFFAFGHTILDSIKSLFFFCFFWITLAVVFLAGTTRVSLFALGYVLGCFIFLWNGNEFYLKPIDLVFRLWKTIIAYTSGVILIKAILQIVGCVYITSLYSNFCWVVQLLGIACLGKYQSSISPSETCIAPYDEAGLLWDGICFAFLIIQKRIFCSYYFCHLIREVKAQQVLASRGAELIHEIQAKEVADQEQAEKEVMEKIKQKMDRIKAAQQKMYADKAKSIKYHKQAVRSGGYYMFDDADSEIVDLNEKPRQSLIPDPEGDEMRNIAKLKGFTAFCAKLMKGQIDPLSEKEATIVSAEATTDVGESSKDSAIVSLDRERVDPSASLPTTLTTLPSTSVSSRPSSLPAAVKDGSKPPHRGSGDEPDIGTEEYDDKRLDRKMSLFSRMKNWFLIFVLFIESALISATAKLNSLSRDYRYVARRLSVEKRYLKKLFEIEESNGSRYDFMDINWKKKTLAKISQATVPKLSKSLDSIEETQRKKRSAIESKKSDFSEDVLVSIDANLEDSSFLKANIYMRFVRSIFYAILSRSEVMCYIMIVINQLSSASVLSLPLPLFAFLWGSLSVPRPSKAFWITVITYTEVIVVIKYIFQFQFWPWLASGKIDITPFYFPRILGIEKADNYATYDLALLLVLFFHRFMLKSLGLWDLSETEITAYMENAEKRNSISLDQTSSADVNGRIKSDKKSKILTEVDSNVMHSYDPIKSDKRVIEEKMGIDYTINDQIGLSEYDGFSEMTPSEDLREEASEGFNAIYTIMIAPTTIKSTAIRFSRPIRHFFHSVLHPPYRITRDVYSLMFLCDFLNFFVLVFGFYAFGSGYGSEDVASFLEENKIPIPFLVTLLLQFALIIIDRAIYLRKYIKGKLVFQIILTLLIHMWLFFALPAMTEKRFTKEDNLPPKLYYVFKCIYFLLSAYQIRSGYPTRILGNTFCKKYNLVNWYLFKGYMIIPFLYDLRMYMDWIWTDTSLVLDEWSLMEDIFVNLYERKCELKLDEEFPEPRGKAKRRFFKYLLGGAWVVIIIGLIWGPLGLFALGRAVGSTNRPVGATFELEFGGYQPLFRMSVTGSALNEISNPLWNRLKTNEDFVKDAVAQTFISGYDQSDVTVVNLNGNSTAVWGISPPSQKSLEAQLRSNVSSINVKLTYYITRKKQQKTQDMEVTISNEQSIDLDPDKDSELRLQLARMLSDEEDENEAAIINHIFPNYLRVPEKGKPTAVKQLIKKGTNKSDSNEIYKYRNVGVLLKKGKYENSSMTSWWEVHDPCDVKYMTHLDDFFKKDLLLNEKCKYLPVVLFNDKVFIGLLAFLSGYGIIGIYTTFVFLVSRWVRGLNSESSFKVIYTRMPNVDRVLQLCLDIYLVRESREFELEEDLYAKLIFLYRSPETLIKWTKPSEELPSRAHEQQAPHQQRIDH